MSEVSGAVYIGKPGRRIVKVSLVRNAPDPIKEIGKGFVKGFFTGLLLPLVVGGCGVSAPTINSDPDLIPADDSSSAHGGPDGSETSIKPWKEIKNEEPTAPPDVAPDAGKEVETEGEAGVAEVDGGAEPLTCDGGPDGIITGKFVDSAFLAAIREALRKGPEDDITVEDVQSLEHLNLWKKGITSISGIECLTKLKTLDLAGNEIVDISPLAALEGLTDLQIGGNKFKDLSPIAGLTGLTRLNIVDCGIKDLTPIAGLVNLTDLSAGLNEIQDISPLAGMAYLYHLNLAYDKIADFSVIANFPDLFDLTLKGCGVADLSFLSGLKNLGLLYLGSNLITDLSPLAEMASISVLDLNDNSVEDISALSGLTELAWIYLENNLIADISPLLYNPGVGMGDFAWLSGNVMIPPEQIEALEAKGVTVKW